MELLEVVNRYFLRWFYVRLIKCQQEKAILDYSLHTTKDERFHVLKADSEVSAIRRFKIWYALQGWVPPSADLKTKRYHSEDVPNDGHWFIRLTRIIEFEREIETEEEWLEYLEKRRCCHHYDCDPYGYHHYHHHHHHHHGHHHCHHHHHHHDKDRVIEEVDVEMTVSYGKLVDE